MAELSTSDTRSGEHGAQELQNHGIVAEVEFVRLMAKLIGKLLDEDITETDVIIKVGAKNAWPSDPPKIDLLAKFKDGLTNPDSKASIRVFVEGKDGQRELLFHQLEGKVLTDPQHLKTAIQAGLIESLVNANEQAPKLRPPSLDDDIEPVQTAAEPAEKETTLQSTSEPKPIGVEYMAILSRVEVPDNLKEFVADPEKLRTIAVDYPQRAKELDWVVAKQARSEGMDEISISGVIRESPYVQTYADTNVDRVREHVQEIYGWAYGDRMQEIYNEQGVTAQPPRWTDIGEDDFGLRYPEGATAPGGLQYFQETTRSTITNLQEQLNVARQELQSLSGQVMALTQTLSQMTKDPQVQSWLKEAQSVFEDVQKPGLMDRIRAKADTVINKAIEKYQEFSYNNPLRIGREIDPLVQCGTKVSETEGRIEVAGYLVSNENKSRTIHNPQGQLIYRDDVQSPNLSKEDQNFLMSFPDRAKRFVDIAHRSQQPDEQKVERAIDNVLVANHKEMSEAHQASLRPPTPVASRGGRR